MGFLTYLVSAEKAKKFCTSCGCGVDPTGVPTGVPTPSPPGDDCKGDDDKIELENEGKKECSKILEKNWCEEKVVGGGTAKKFCTSCGCGDDPVPTPSPPDDDCKGGDDKIDLKNGGEQKCKNIFKDGLCEEKVQGGGKAKNFCTSCGCGEDPVPTPSPPDDDCKGGDDKIDLKNGGEQKCKNIFKDGLCE